LSEIIDNAIDNFAKQASLGRAVEELRVTIQARDESILIRETSGGVTPDDLVAFVQVGAQGELGSDTPRIGVWGEGQKHAVAALGNDIEISTRYWDARKKYEVSGHMTDQVVIRMDPKWWADQQDWNIPVLTPDHDLTRGETLFEIHQLNSRIDDAVIQELHRDLANLYGDILTEQKAAIRINDKEVE